MDVFSYLLGKKSSGSGESITDYFDKKIDTYNPGSIIKKIPEGIYLDDEITELNGSFYGWNKITEIPLFDTSNVTNMAWMFEGCSSLVTIPSFNTSNVENFGGMFSGCSSLETVPQLNGASVTGSSVDLLQHMFEECSSLSNESLRNILKFLLTCANYTGIKRLKFIGLNSTQANYCRTLSEWATLESQGWSTGY